MRHAASAARRHETSIHSALLSAHCRRLRAAGSIFFALILEVKPMGEIDVMGDDWEGIV